MSDALSKYQEAINTIKGIVARSSSLGESLGIPDRSAIYSGDAVEFYQYASQQRMGLPKSCPKCALEITTPFQEYCHEAFCHA